MHTLVKDGDGTWCVYRSEMCEGGTQYTMIFKGMPLKLALRAVNCLNGGEGAGDGLVAMLEKYHG